MSLLTERAARLGLTADSAVWYGFLDDQGRVLPARPLMPARPKTATKDHTMKNAHMIVPVTAQLAGELAGAAALISKLSENQKLNDRDHFTPAVDQLEALAVAVLASTSSTPLTAWKAPSARFALYSGGPLNTHLILVVSYLRDDVSELLGLGGFERFSSRLTDVALGYLKQLEGMIRNEIVKAAERDLAKLSQSGINELLTAATARAKATTGNKQDTAEPSDEGLASSLDALSRKRQPDQYVASTGADFPDGRK